MRRSGLAALAMLGIAAAPPPEALPRGATLLKGEAVRALVTGATMSGLATGDGPPIATDFLPDGRYRMSGPAEAEGTYAVVRDALCLTAARRTFCKAIARVVGGGYLIGTPFGGEGDGQWVWAPVTFARPAGR